jgi:starch-binding outer membrane protein SusE/F
MKNVFSYILLLLLFASCKKDEIKSVYSLPAGSPSFTSSIETAVLDSTHRDEVAAVFSWSSLSYGINADVTYSLEFDTSNTMAHAIAFVMNADTTKSYTVAALNAIALQTGLEGSKAGTLYVRMKGEVRQNGTSTNPSTIPVTYSEVLALTVTAYAPSSISRMWVPGEYQGWNAATAPTIADVGGKGAYEGYIYFPNNASGNYTFKITTAPNWNDPAWGYESDTKMVKGGGNFYTSGEGYFLVRANVNSRDWSTTLTTWSLVGDAVADDWETDIPMTYDAVSGTWVANSVAVKGSGGFKFRANKGWTLNYGPTDGKLVQDGGNISAPGGVAGNYKVVLNLSESGNYTYTLTKL